MQTRIEEQHNQLKEQDMRIALRIAGIAGISCRDRHGNVVSEVWTQQSTGETENTQLLDIAVVRNMLVEQLKVHLEARREALIDLDDPGIVAKWILQFSHEWEKAYRERAQQHWDMSQSILTAMDETVTMVKEVFENLSCGLTYDYMLQKVTAIYGENYEEDYETNYGDDYEQNDTNQQKNQQKNQLKYTDPHDALTRAMFRSRYIGPLLINLAGKILQKRLVCNKAGMYSARVQRNDVTREKDSALEAIITAHFDDDPVFEHCKTKEFDDMEKLRAMCIDHTRTKTQRV